MSRICAREGRDTHRFQQLCPQLAGRGRPDDGIGGMGVRTCRYAGRGWRRAGCFLTRRALPLIMSQRLGQARIPANPETVLCCSDWKNSVDRRAPVQRYPRQKTVFSIAV